MWWRPVVDSWLRTLDSSPALECSLSATADAADKQTAFDAAAAATTTAITAAAAAANDDDYDDDASCGLTF